MNTTQQKSAAQDRLKLLQEIINTDPDEEQKKDKPISQFDQTKVNPYQTGQQPSHSLMIRSQGSAKLFIHEILTHE